MKKSIISLLIFSLYSISSLASCPQVFDEVEPGFCDKQKETKNFSSQYYDYRHELQYPDDGIVDRNGNLNWRPSYDTVSVNLTSKELLLTGAVAASAIIAFNNDEDLMDFVQDNKNDITEHTAYWGEKAGSMVLPLAAGGYVIGVVFKNGKIKKMSKMMIKAGVITGLITRVMKMSFSRKRPNMNEGAYEFAGFEMSNDNVSFPSGHTTSAFSFATVIAETYKDSSTLIPVLAYTAAAIGGWSRMHDNAHWASDVLIGALVGHLTTKKLMNMEEENSNSKYKMSIYPVFGSQYAGIHFTIKPINKTTKEKNKFYDKCIEFYKVNPQGQDPRRICTLLYLQATYNQ